MGLLVAAASRRRARPGAAGDPPRSERSSPTRAGGGPRPPPLRVFPRSDGEKGEEEIPPSAPAPPRPRAHRWFSPGRLPGTHDLDTARRELATPSSSRKGATGQRARPTVPRVDLLALLPVCRRLSPGDMGVVARAVHVRLIPPSLFN